jgi:lipid-A-disaccharide synthase
MVNLIAGRQVVTELIQDDLTPDRLETELTRLLDPAAAATVRTALHEVRQQLGAPGAYGRSADEILELL